MKLKIVSILIVVMILIIQIPAFADMLIPEQPEDAFEYWVIYEDNVGDIYLDSSHNPIKVTMDEQRLKLLGYQYYKLVNGQWVYKGWGRMDEYSYSTFKEIYQSNHDIEYEDGSGFFFRAEESESNIPDDEENGIWENLEDFFSWFNPGSWLNDIIDSVQESVGLLAEPIEELREGFNNFLVGIGEIINLLNPFHERFFLRVAFIPSNEYVEEFRTVIKAKFDDKFSFISEIRDFLAFIFSSPIIDNPGPPEFEITLPGGKWGSGSVQIIDFSIFEDYRLFIINFIRVLLWIPFLIKLYKRLPSIVY